MSSQKSQPVAVFDIDGTIFRSSLLIKLVEELVARGDFPEEARAKYQKYENAWVERRGSYEEYITKVIDSFMKHLKGVPYKNFESAAKAVAKKDLPLRYRYTSELMQKLKKKGYFILAISQSPWTVLEDFCKSLGFDKVYGRFYEIDADEVLTGKVRSEELISDKAGILKRAVLKNGLSLKDAYAVGDTEGDISMLSVVDNPVCFNPNKALATVAKKKGWLIVVERKDTAYEWDTKKGTVKIL